VARLIWIFGDNVEDRMGSVRFVILWIAAETGKQWANAIRCPNQA
jgi:membrane associated rhomboid family serine protease